MPIKVFGKLITTGPLVPDYLQDDSTVLLI